VRTLPEYLDVAPGVLAEPAHVRGGTITASDRSGAGIAWDEQAAER
jgi:hypothetical protein